MEPDIYLVGHRCMKGLLGVAGYLICDPTKNEKNNTVERWMFFSPTWMFFVFHFGDMFLFSFKIKEQHLPGNSLWPFLLADCDLQLGDEKVILNHPVTIIFSSLLLIFLERKQLLWFIVYPDPRCFCLQDCLSCSPQFLKRSNLTTFFRWVAQPPTAEPTLNCACVLLLIVFVSPCHVWIAVSGSLNRW